MLIKCKECGNQVSDHAETCPSCGIKVIRKSTAIQIIGSVLKVIVLVAIWLPIVLFLFIAMNDRNKTPETPTKESTIVPEIKPVPSTEEPGIKIKEVLSFQNEFETSRTSKLASYDNAINQIQKSAIYNKANQDMESILSKYGTRVDKWLGKIDLLTTEHGGKTVNVHIKSRNNVIYKSFNDIKAGSSLYQQLSSIHEDQDVEFTGELVQRYINKTWEISETERGSLEEPEYFVNFISIQSVTHDVASETISDNKSDVDQNQPPPEVVKNISIADDLNDKCRGGSGDDPKTMEYCEQRDALIEQINKQGWCYGHEPQAMYERKWEVCRDNEKPQDSPAAMAQARQYSDDPTANCLIKATEFQFVGNMRDNMTYDEAMRYRPDLAPIIQEMFKGSLKFYSTEQVHEAIARECIEKYQR